MKIYYASAYTPGAKSQDIVEASYSAATVYCTRKPDVADLFTVHGGPHPEHHHRLRRAGGGPDAEKYNERMSYIRNSMIEEFLATDCTHIWFNDADQIVFPDVLEELAKWADEREEACLAVVAPVRSSTNPRCFNYLWLNDDGSAYRQPGLVPATSGNMSFMVDVGAACWLVPRDPVEAGARYAHDRRGTDVYFSEQLKKNGCSICVLPWLRTFHHMESGEEPLYSHDNRAEWAK